MLIRNESTHILLNSTSSTTTISVLGSVFATHGVPEHLVSDNGSGFTSAEFKEFTESQGILHTCTSPYHPSSNGLVERAVQTIKRGVALLTGDIGSRINKFLLNYRITPQSSTGVSPSELLMGRRIRTCLDEVYPDTGRTVLKKQEQQQRRIPFNLGEQTFQVGDQVYAIIFSEGRGNKWIPAEVINATGPVSYHVRLHTGIVSRRHKNQLRRRHLSGKSLIQIDTPDSEAIDDDFDDLTLNPPVGSSRSAPLIVIPPTTQSNSIPPLSRSTRNRHPPLRFSPVRS